jgi:hypothetical protein
MEAVHRRQQEETGKASGMELAGVLAEVDGIMAEQGVGNLSNLVGALHDKGYMQKVPGLSLLSSLPSFYLFSLIGLLL